MHLVSALGGYWSGFWRPVDPGREHYFPPVRILIGNTAIGLPVIDLRDRIHARGREPSLHALARVCIGQVEHQLIKSGRRAPRTRDILKALALGAKGVFIGRPHCWGLMAFGAVGVQRVVELLHAELTVAMGLAGATNLAAIKRSMVRLPWE